MLFIGLIAGTPVFAQENAANPPLTQAQFAVELVKEMRLERLLPVAPLPRDSVNLLERLGISPLKGWVPKANLRREDYLVLVGKARGKEKIIHERAYQVELKNIEIINQQWQKAQGRTGQWPTLDELFNDQNAFPHGAPQSPYGLEYRDRNGDHKIDPYFSLIANLMK